MKAAADVGKHPAEDGHDAGAPGAPPARTLAQAEAEREALARELFAHQRQITAATERLRALEHVLDTIRNTRAYRFLRAMGRWPGVEATFRHLFDDDSLCLSAMPLADAARSLRIRAHNVPAALPADADFTVGIHIENTGQSTIRLPAQHTRFWSSSANPSELAVAIQVDGRHHVHAQVPDNRIRGGRKTTVFFPLHTGSPGDHRIDLWLTSVDSSGGTPAESHRLCSLPYRVDAGRRAVSYLGRLRQAVFMLRLAEWPRLLGRIRCARAKAEVARAHSEQDRRRALQCLKAENKRLVFIEQQTRRERVASRPCYVSVDTTVACNLRCPMCYREDPVARTVLPEAPHMTPEILDDVIGWLMPTAYTINPSTWGEPLLSPHLDRLIEACAAYGVYMSFTTNGVLLNRRGLLERLVPVLHWLEISVDSTNAERFETMRTGARFAQVVNNAHEVGRIRVARPQPAFNLGFSMTLFRDNLHELPEMLNLVADCGGNFLKADIGVIFNRALLEHSVLTGPGDYNSSYEQAHRRASALGVKLFMRSPFTEGELSEASRYGVCDYLYTSASIRTDGSYKPCYSSVLPSRSAASNSNLRTLWNSPEMRRLRRVHDTDRAPASCRTCYVTRRGRETLAARHTQFIKLEELRSGKR